MFPLAKGSAVQTVQAMEPGFYREIAVRMQKFAAKSLLTFYDISTIIKLS